MLEHITPMILTFNEEANIGRTLEKLRWARRIVIIDSGSNDDTLRIVSGYPHCEVLYRKFDTFAAQCNFGLGHIGTEWVLSLDADYVLSDGLVLELGRIDTTEASVAGYSARFRYSSYGRLLRGTLYPPRNVLYRVKSSRYEDHGHSHRVHLDGPVRQLREFIFHDDRKPLSRWLDSQQKYARTEAQYLLAQPWQALSPQDRLRRRIWPAPMLVFAYALIVKACLFDGWPGWFYAIQRLYAEILLSLELLDRALSSDSEGSEK